MDKIKARIVDTIWPHCFAFYKSKVLSDIPNHIQTAFIWSKKHTEKVTKCIEFSFYLPSWACMSKEFLLIKILKN